MKSAEQKKMMPGASTSRSSVAKRPCSACSGTRLNRLALSVNIGGRSIADATRMTPPELLAFLAALSFPEKQQAIAAPV